jgi:hypothetical protein
VTVESRRPTETEEDRLILELLESGGLNPSPAESDEAQVLGRLYRELLGLMAQSVEPLPASAAGKERLLATVRQLEPPLGERRVRVVPFEPPTEPSVPAPESEPRRRPIWLAVAASLGVVCIGGGLYFLQALDGERSARRSAELERDRAVAEVRQLLESRDSLSTRLASLESEKLGLVQKLAWLSEPGSAICALKPPQSAVYAGRGGAARGALVVAANHQHWFLRVSGLPEVSADQAYHFWFLTKQGAVLGGTFQVAANADAEIGSPTMPTEMTGVAITVEPLVGTTAPSGEQVLFGDEMVIVA